MNSRKCIAGVWKMQTQNMEVPKFKSARRVLLYLVTGLAALAVTWLLIVPQVDERKREITSVSLKRTACFGTCPVYTVSISKDGGVVFNGEYYVEKTGRQTATIPALEWDRLTEFIFKSGFFSLKDSYSMEVTDLPSQTVTVSYMGGTKKVYRYGWEAPATLIELEELIDEIANTKQWVGEP